MPPTFFIFLGLIAYLGLTALTCLVFIPMLFLDSKRLFAKKVIATVLISFPCLLVAGLFFAIIFILPALLFSWLANEGYISKTPGIILAVTGLIIFAGLVAISALYLWYFVSKLIYQRLDNKPVQDFLDNDKVFKFLRPYLIRFKFYNPAS
jgi:hypothetical protein